MHTNLIYPLILNTLWGIKKWQKKRKSWVTDQQKERTQGISSREKTRKAKEITRLVGHCCLCYCCCSAVVAAGWECVVIYDNFIVLSARCPFYFRLCLCLCTTHTHTHTVTHKNCARIGGGCFCVAYFYARGVIKRFPRCYAYWYPTELGLKRVSLAFS